MTHLRRQAAHRECGVVVGLAQERAETLTAWEEQLLREVRPFPGLSEEGPWQLAVAQREAFDYLLGKVLPHHPHMQPPDS